MIVTAYFHSKMEAQMAERRLGTFYKVTEPHPVIALNGRSWVIEVTVPPTYILGRTVDPEVLARITAVVNLYDGHIHSGDQP